MNKNNDRITITLPKTTADYMAMLVDGLASEYVGIKSLDAVEDVRLLSYHKDSDDVIAEPTDILKLKQLVNALRGK